jgi:hypothetical protein
MLCGRHDVVNQGKASLPGRIRHARAVEVGERGENVWLCALPRADVEDDVAARDEGVRE